MCVCVGVWVCGCVPSSSFQTHPVVGVTYPRVNFKFTARSRPSAGTEGVPGTQGIHGHLGEERRQRRGHASPLRGMAPREERSVPLRTESLRKDPVCQELIEALRGANRSVDHAVGLYSADQTVGTLRKLRESAIISLCSALGAPDDEALCCARLILGPKSSATEETTIDGLLRGTYRSDITSGRLSGAGHTLQSLKERLRSREIQRASHLFGREQLAALLSGLMLDIAREGVVRLLMASAGRDADATETSLRPVVLATTSSKVQPVVFATTAPTPAPPPPPPPPPPPKTPPRPPPPPPPTRLTDGAVTSSSDAVASSSEQPENQVAFEEPITDISLQHITGGASQMVFIAGGDIFLPQNVVEDCGYTSSDMVKASDVRTPS